MTRVQKPKNSKSNVVSIEPEPGGNVAVAEEPEPETPFDDPQASSEPVASATPAKPPHETRRALTFWERVRAIPKAEWGARAYIYVYCLEPICNLKLQGETKFLVRLQEPVDDQNFLMADYGSGKYRLVLVQRKPAADKSDTVDSIEVEIYNPKYPPKIPRSVWVNDRRNDRWAALLPKEEPVAPPTPLGAVSDAFKTFSEIQQNIRREITPPPAAPLPEPPDRVAEFRGMLAVAKEMMPPPQPATDNKVLDTVVSLLMKQIDTAQAETKELRQELRDAMKERHGDHDSFDTLFEKFEKIAPRVQSLLGVGGDKLTDVVHGRRRPWWEETLTQLIPAIAPGINSLAGAAANYFLMPKGGLGAPAAPPNGQANLPAPQAPPDPLQPLRQKVGNFLGANLAAVQKYFTGFVQGAPSELDPESKMDGEDLAIWINTGNPDILRDARSLGSANLVAMFQAAPAIWVNIQPHEARFRTFLDQVLSFSPDEPEADEGKPVDLTEEK
jgi:hypothetical protein